MLQSIKGEVWGRQQKQALLKPAKRGSLQPRKKLYKGNGNINTGKRPFNVKANTLIHFKTVS